MPTIERDNKHNLPAMHKMHASIRMVIVFCFSSLLATASYNVTLRHTLDSLNRIIDQAPSSLPAAEAYVTLSDQLYLTNIDTVIPLCKKAISITEPFVHSPEKEVRIKVIQVKALALNNIGYVYGSHGKTAKALEYYLAALKLRESINDQRGIGESLNNIGTVYKNQGNVERAIEYYQKSFLIRSQIGEKRGQAVVLSNMASLHNDHAMTNGQIEEYKDALNYYQKGLKIYQDLTDSNGIANVEKSLGDVYHNIQDIPNAEKYYHQALMIQEKTDNKTALVHTLYALAKIEFEQGRRSEAKQLALKDLNISTALNFSENTMEVCFLLYQIYNSEKNYESALKMHEKYVQLKDTIYNEENTRSAIQAELNYDFEKKQAATKLEEEHAQALADAENRKQRVIIGAISIVLLLVLALGGVILRSLRINQYNTKIISEQKALVEQKHREISDSILYSERIQRTFSASKKFLDANLSSYFIFFKPKDVVSGDFYWGARLSDGRFGLVIGDSTGHGVPGAIMSILNIYSLEKAVELGISEPSEIFNHARKTIIDHLKNDGSAEGGSDGMDGSFMAFDFNHKQLTYASAYSSIWIARDQEIIELPTDKMPVGKHIRDTISFTQQTIQLRAGDMLYAFTDGMADQFGGPQGKKFMYRRMKELIQTISSLSPEKQYQYFSAALIEWQGDIEQVDDITIIGIRI